MMTDLKIALRNGRNNQNQQNTESKPNLQIFFHPFVSYSLQQTHISHWSLYAGQQGEPYPLSQQITRDLSILQGHTRSHREGQTC